MLLGMPHARPMSVIGPRCWEVRVPDPDVDKTWCIIYRSDDDFIVIVEVFAKKTQATPDSVIKTSRERLRRYDTERAALEMAAQQRKDEQS